MSVVSFGENKILYRVIEKGERMEVHVYHRNKSWRKTIKDNAGNPACFLKLSSFTGTNPRARYWLAKFVQSYSVYFRNDAVTFIFH